MAETTEQAKSRRLRKTQVGIVTSANKTPKTIRVEVQYRVRHSKYGKFVRRTLRLHAHDEKAEAKAGDRVQVMECRPMSRTKTWRLVKVLTPAPKD